MKLWVSFLILAWCGVVRAAPGEENSLLPKDFEARLEQYAQRLDANYQVAVNTGIASYGGALRAVYGNRVNEEVRRAEKYRREHGLFPALQVGNDRPASVVVNPMARTVNLDAYVEEEMIVVGPPGWRNGYDPLRQGAALIHECTHLAQTVPGRYPRWLVDIWGQLEEFHPEDSGSYLLSAEEMEVRLAEFHRLMWLMNGGPPTPQLAARWLVALGVERVIGPSNESLRVEKLDRSQAAEVLQCFPGFSALLTVIAKQVEGEAEVRRQRLIGFFEELTPALP